MQILEMMMRLELNECGQVDYVYGDILDYRIIADRKLVRRHVLVSDPSVRLVAEYRGRLYRGAEGFSVRDSSAVWLVCYSVVVKEVIYDDGMCLVFGSITLCLSAAFRDVSFACGGDRLRAHQIQRIVCDYGR